MAGEESKTSVQDIAAMLLTPVEADTEEVVEEEDNSPPEGTDDDLTTDDADGEQEQEEADDTEGDEGGAEDDTDDDQGSDTLEISDDDIIEVMIDGQLETRTVGELKKALSLAGATEKRLQEATEVRKAAIAERTTALENLAAQERIIAASFSDLEETLFKPVIPAPDPKMKGTNPAAYLRHKEAYDEDQARIAVARKAVQDKVAELATQRQTRLREYGEVAAKQIAATIPELVDPKKSAQMLERLVGTAKAYGYTDQEISGALDPRMFHLVRDAMLYRELTSRAKEKVVDINAQRNKAPRKLRAGNSKAASLVASRSKQQSEVKAVAQKTGKVADVARTLLQPKVK